MESLASPWFVGRRAELEVLTRAFANKSKNAMVIVQGLAGSGKSALAAEFVQHHTKMDYDYDVVRWFDVSSEEKVKEAYFALGDDLGLQPKDSEEEFKEAIDNALASRHNRVFLVFDGVETVSSVQDYLPSSTISSSKTIFHCLITTRLDSPCFNFDNHALQSIKKASTKVTTISLKGLDSQEVLDYLSLRLERNDIPLILAEQLGYELGWLPLGIAETTSLIIEKTLSIESCLRQLHSENRKNFLPNTILTLQNASLCSELSNTALQLMQFCSYLEPENIPSIFLEVFLKKMNNNDSKGLLELLQHTLITKVNKGDGYQINPLLQQAIRNQHNSQVGKMVIEMGLEAMKALLENTRAKSSSQLYLFWKEHPGFFPQVHQLLIEGESVKIRDDLIALLLEWAGDYHYSITLKYDQSLELYQRSLAMRRTLDQENFFGEKYSVHLDLAASLEKLGCLYESQAHYDDALTCLEESLFMRRNLLGNHHEHIAFILNRMGAVYSHQCHYAKSLKYHEEALAIRKIVFGEDSVSVANSLNNIGSVYRSQGKYDKALECHQLALRIRKAAVNDYRLCPDVALSLNNIGGVYEAQRQFNKALEYYQEALTISRSILGDYHPSVAVYLSNVGSVYDQQGQHQNAMEFHQQALAIRQTVLGDDHPDVATSLNNIGEVCRAQGQFDRALECYQQSLAIKKAIYGENHPSLAISLNNMGVVCQKQRRHDSAREYYQKCLSIRKAFFDLNHPLILLTQKNIDLCNAAQRLSNVH